MSKTVTVTGLCIVVLGVASASAQTIVVNDDFTGYDSQTLENVGGWGINVNNTSPGGDFSQFTIRDTGIPGIGEALQPITSCCPNADRFWDVPAEATKLHISWDMISTNGGGNQGFKVGDNPMQSADGGGTWINGFTAGGNWVANPTDGDGNNGDQHNYGAITNDEIVTMHVDVDATAGTATFLMTGPTLGRSDSYEVAIGGASIEDE